MRLTLWYYDDIWREEMNNRVVPTDYKQLIRESILNEEDFIKATFSGQHRDRTVPWIKVIVRPVLVRGKKHAQFSYFDAKKDITKNYHGDETAAMLEQLLALEFKNVHVQTTRNNVDVTITKKGKALISTTKSGNQRQETHLSHDRQKNVLLTPADAAPFLKAVGIMTEDGRIRADMQSKFRQINEFLKLVHQTGELEKFTNVPLHVVYSGCGNAYITFDFFYYLNQVLHIPTHLTGIDVNGELLTRHAEKSLSLGWSDLTFETTSIIDFKPTMQPDIVLALHACDTATDEALAQGIKWQSKLIISAPCCQHHLQKQLDHSPAPNPFGSVERYSILKERLGDILTDTFRALILRIMGYQTDVVQFVSSEHTAKNLMIRAVKSLKVGDAKFVQEYKDLKDFWNVTPYLEQLLGEDFAKLL
ncbi:MAG: SAM-dependent methyltransferase [Chloroflexota bacterium]|nr:SAM-dependent methyltransferase [Chloroflexota bacterium]